MMVVKRMRRRPPTRTSRTSVGLAIRRSGRSSREPAAEPEACSGRAPWSRTMDASTASTRHPARDGELDTLPLER